MILVRNIFQVKFGKMRDAVAIWKDGKRMIEEMTNHRVRIMTDLTGPYYTLVMESESPSITEWEREMGNMSSQEFKDWYQRLVPLVESGHREIFTIVE